MHRLSAQKILIDNRWEPGKSIVIKDGVIKDIVTFNPYTDKCLEGWLVPGFIDVQVNGGGGVLFNSDPTNNGVQTIMSAHRKFGTTSMLPTIITDTAETMRKAADAIALARSEDQNGIVGVHFEGPFLDTTKKGIHKEEFIRELSDEELDVITRKDIGKVLLTVAPDRIPPDVIKALVNQGIIISLGHSNATFEQVVMAIEAGATGFTHLFNAMSPLTSREPGMVGAAMNAKSAYAGIILDGEHVHPISAKLAIQAKGIDRIMLVTDAMPHVGSEASSLPFFDTNIERQDNRLTTPDGTLAGSCLNMASAIKYAYEQLGFPLHDCVDMATRVPATFLGLENSKGKIAKTFDADFVLLNDELLVSKVYKNGTLVHD